jgi:hypothetical protein
MSRQLGINGGLLPALLLEEGHQSIVCRAVIADKAGHRRREHVSKSYKPGPKSHNLMTKNPF